MGWSAADIEASKVRCAREWDTVNDPPCHPSDADWRPCPLCVADTPDNAPPPSHVEP